MIGTNAAEQVKVARQLRRTNSTFVPQIPYFNDVEVNDVHATLEELIDEVET